MGARQGLAPLVTAALLLGLAIALSAAAYLLLSNQAALSEGIMLRVSSEGELLALERVGYVYMDHATCRLWISNDGSVDVVVQKIFSDGLEAWSGSRLLKPGEVALFQLSACGDKIIILTSRGIHKIRG